jgi:hypothetical protein
VFGYLPLNLDRLGAHTYNLTLPAHPGRCYCEFI